MAPGGCSDRSTEALERRDFVYDAERGVKGNAAMTMGRLLFSGLLLLGAMTATQASARALGRCGFDVEKLDFKGSPTEQARCLMSPVLIGGDLGPAPAQLGAVLEDRVGKATTLDKTKLRKLLADEGLAGLATSLDFPVSRTAQGVSARYFVIHDTSQFYAGTKFPPETDASLNKLGFKHKDGTWVAHAFINRRGEVFVGYDFKTPWRATQLEGSAHAGARSRGLFLHVEHNQPRRSDPAGKPGNDRLSPTPGFADAQYDRSALLYITASVRAGRWLVPAFHAVLDSKGVGDHDDPQSFDRQAFEAALSRRLAQLEAKTFAGWTLRASLYYTALEADYPAGDAAVFRTRTGETIHRASPAFVAKAVIEGSAKLNDGRVINVDGVVADERRWKVIPQAYGLDALGCGLVPFRSVAVDRAMVPLRTKLYLPKTVGMKLPDGTTHDGIWYAVDTGGAILNDRMDLFLGAGKASMDVPREHGVGHLEGLEVQSRGTFTGCAPT